MALNVAGMAQALLLQVVLARLLGHEGYGQFAYVMAWINILVYVAVMGHDTLVMRSVAAHTPGRNGRFWPARCAMPPS